MLLSSEALEKEIAAAPPDVQGVFRSIPANAVERAETSLESNGLARAYLQAGVIGKRWLEDCRHVAAATVARADAIVSWNFKHIVRLDRIKGYNQVNLLAGYGMITIVSPKEVRFDD